MLPVGELVPGVRKLAVLRANALGDFVFALPAVTALKAAYPAAEVVLLGRAWHADFLAGRPGPIDRVVAVPPSRGVNGGEQAAEDAGELARFFAGMWDERFDLAVQLHGGGRFSNPFVGRLGARVTAGSRAADAGPLDRWVPYRLFQPEYARLLGVAALAGAAPVALEPEIAVTPADLAEADRAAPAGGRPLAVLHPGASDPRRRWPPDRFAAVADALAGRGCRVAVVGVADERAVADAVIGAARSAVADACGRLTLGGLAGLLSRAAVVVANDSGPLHLAHAVGARAVGVYWGVNVVNSPPLTRSRHAVLASFQPSCPACGRPTVGDRCGHTGSLVLSVTADQVIAAAIELLNGG